MPRWLLNDLVVTHNKVSAIEIERTSNHVITYRRDTYTFILLTRGRWWAELDYGTINVGSARSASWISRCRARLRRRAGKCDAGCAALAVDAAVPATPRLHGRLLEGASGRLFAEHMVALSRHLPEMRMRDVPLMREATISLLISAVAGLSPEQTGARLRATRTTSAAQDQGFHRRQFDRGRSGDRANLPRSRGDAADALSRAARRRRRRQLYPAAAAGSGARAPVRSRRDAHACRARRPILLQQPAHFSTAFRRRFGYAPRSAKGTPMRPAMHPACSSAGWAC